MELLCSFATFVLLKNSIDMVYLIREISKLCMFTILWAFPIALAHMFNSNYYLWFFILSLIVNVGMFSHYESLEKIDALKNIGNNTQENNG